MQWFSYIQLPGRVVFGVGALDQPPREIECAKPVVDVLSVTL
jgi:hypothetical protein